MQWLSLRSRRKTTSQEAVDAYLILLTTSKSDRKSVNCFLKSNNQDCVVCVWGGGKEGCRTGEGRTGLLNKKLLTDYCIYQDEKYLKGVLENVN